MTRRSTAAQAAKAALFGAAASSATATILLLISICVALPLRVAPQNDGVVTSLVS
jgi:hypothetical protein